MPSGPPPPCMSCEHLRVMNPDEPWLCAAYPSDEGVPDDIMLGSTHFEVRPDQVGTAVYRLAAELEQVKGKALPNPE